MCRRDAFGALSDTVTLLRTELILKLTKAQGLVFYNAEIVTARSDSRLKLWFSPLPLQTKTQWLRVVPPHWTVHSFSGTGVFLTHKCNPMEFHQVETHHYQVQSLYTSACTLASPQICSLPTLSPSKASSSVSLFSSGIQNSLCTKNITFLLALC
jgi:hypothetical protein